MTFINADEMAKMLPRDFAGNPVAIWRDGRVVIVPPEEIVAGEDKEKPQALEQP